MLRSKNMYTCFSALLSLMIIRCAITPPSSPVSPAGTSFEPRETITWKTHTSSLGFSIDLPSYYLVLSREELIKNPDLFEGAFTILERGYLKTATKTFMEQLKTHLDSGNVEFYYNQHHRGVLVNVTKAIGEIPTTYSGLLTYCGAILPDYEKSTGIKTTLHQCQFRDVAGVNAVYMVTEDLGFDMFAQYLVQTSPSIQLCFTTSAENQIFETPKKELDEIMKSLKLR